MSDEQNIWKVYYSDGGSEFIEGEPVDKPHCHVVHKVKLARVPQGVDDPVVLSQTHADEVHARIATLTTELDKLRADLFSEQSCRTVEKWPAWKQKLLGGKASDQAEIVEELIATLTAEREQVRELVEAVEKMGDPESRQRVKALATQLKEQQDDN